MQWLSSWWGSGSNAPIPTGDDFHGEVPVSSYIPTTSYALARKPRVLRFSPDQFFRLNIPPSGSPSVRAAYDYPLVSNVDIADEQTLKISFAKDGVPPLVFRSKNGTEAQTVVTTLRNKCNLTAASPRYGFVSSYCRANDSARAHNISPDLQESAHNIISSHRTPSGPHSSTLPTAYVPGTMREGPLAVVIDTGSHMCKLGYAGYEAPFVCVPTVVGAPRTSTGMGQQELIVGAEAKALHSKLALRNPVTRGVIQNWEDIVHIWTQGYRILGAKPHEHPVLLTESINNPRQCRANMASIMFESFKVPSLYFVVQPVLSLLAQGLSFGMAVDVGDGVIQCVPVSNGAPVPRCSRVLDFAGQDITNYLMSLSNDEMGRSTCPGLTGDFLGAEKLKEENARILLNPTWGTSRVVTSTSTTTTSSSSAFTQCMELLFNPSLLFGAKTANVGLHTAVWEAIKACTDPELQTQMLASIVPSGGTTNASGFDERLRQELTVLAPPQMNVQVLQPHPKRNRAYSAWIGGSTLCSLPMFDQMLISKAQYDEYGASVLNNCWMS
ncbi:actin, cytoplasmic [Pelomyxa schiedti]|nr:actin, cytoplasmic [Pelomyxa schiedti]